MYVAWRSLITSCQFRFCPSSLYLKWIFFRRDQAQGGVLDSEVADVGGQAHPGPEVVWFVVGDDLLDVHRRRQLIERKMLRIDDADAAKTQEPQFAIRGFCDNRAIAAGIPMAAHSVGTVENRTPGSSALDGRPRRPTQSRAIRTKPQARYSQTEWAVILHHPVNRIAGQSVLAGERENATVFDPAQAAVSCGPEGPVPIDVETADHPSPSPSAPAYEARS